MKKHSEIAEEPDPLLLTRNLLSIAIDNISYIRGLFPEKYFNDIFVPELDMKIKKLMPMDAESRRLTDWMEKGVYDLLGKKYLKTFMFCIREEKSPLMEKEEYAFSFAYPNTSSEEVTMFVSRAGGKKSSTEFKSNAAQITPERMRSSACKMIRKLVSLMRTFDQMAEERTILMKMSYYDDITPEDYEPPYFKCCAGNEAINIWNKNPLKMEVGDVNSKYLVLALKVKSVLDPSDDNSVYKGDDCLIFDNEFDQDDDFSVTEPSKRKYGYVLVSTKQNIKFILDSGATYHICNEESIMKNLRDVKEEYQVPVLSCGGLQLKPEKIGSVITKDFRLSQVRYIPAMAFNVVSVGQLASQGLLINTGDGRFSITAFDHAQLVGEGFLKMRRDKENGTEYHEYNFRTMDWICPGDDEELIDNAKVYEKRSTEQEKEWIIDTGCGRHMTPDLSVLSNARKERQSMRSASGVIWSTHKGTVKTGKFVLKNVGCFPDITDYLMSGPMLDLSGYRITFNSAKCTIVHRDGLKLVGEGTIDKKSRLYMLKADEEKKDKSATAEEGRKAGTPDGKDENKRVADPEVDDKDVKSKDMSARRNKRMRLK